MTAGDLRSALRLAARETERDRPRRMALTLGPAALVGYLWLALRMAGVSPVAEAGTWVAATLAIALALFAGLVALRRR